MVREPECKFCNKHKCGCHASCEKYKKWLVEHEKEKAEISKKKAEIGNFIIYSKQRQRNMATRRKVRVNHY